MTRTRVIAALILTPVAIAAILLLPTPWLVALAAVVFLVGLWEWFRLADIDDTLARTVLLVVNMALMVAIVWGSRTSSGFNYVLLQIMTVVGVVWWLLAMLWLKHFDFASDHATHARVFKLAAGTLAIVPAWCALGWLHGGDPAGHRWLFVALAIVWAADSGAYFAGRHYGKRKLAPRISPNKTIAGLVGGMVSAGLAGYAWAELMSLSATLFWLAPVFAVTAQCGDLFESWMKRKAGVKDSGKWLPGHGGALDRLDGLVVVATLTAAAQLAGWLR